MYWEKFSKFLVHSSGPRTVGYHNCSANYRALHKTEKEKKNWTHQGRLILQGA